MNFADLVSFPARADLNFGAPGEATVLSVCPIFALTVAVVALIAPADEACALVVTVVGPAGPKLWSQFSTPPGASRFLRGVITT